MSVSIAIAGIAVLLFLVVWFRNRAGIGKAPDIDLDTATNADLHRLIMAGRKIDAIKVYRRLHRVDLKAAKEAVEQLAAELPPSPR